MKLTIEKSQLTQSLTIVSKGMLSRTTLPILSSVYIETTERGITLRTTDLEISIQHTIDALVEESGATVVPGKLLTDIVKSLPDAAITLEQKQDELLIYCLDSRFSLHTLNPADFPTFPQIENHTTITLPAGVLAPMVKKASRAISKDESRAVLTGILIKITEDTLQLVATDSYRLAVAKTKLERENQEPIALITPGIVLDEIARLISNEEEICISESENQIVFSFGTTTFVTRKIEGSYPNYEAIVPNEKNCSAVVDAQALLSAVKRVSITAQQHTPIRLAVSPESQNIEVSSKTQDVASATEFVPAHIEGEATEIGFNHQYIIDGLNAVDTEEVLFEAQGSLKPGIFKSVGEGYFFYLTMPVRLDK
jgi:DNA polymerase-3 subunit beta